jgi:hypothetical protein
MYVQLDLFKFLTVNTSQSKYLFQFLQLYQSHISHGSYDFQIECNQYTKVISRWYSILGYSFHVYSTTLRYSYLFLTHLFLSLPLDYQITLNLTIFNPCLWCNSVTRNLICQNMEYLEPLLPTAWSDFLFISLAGR